jgi:Protein of unknown function (DUF3168)
MSDPAWEVQKAIKTLLEADADLATAMGGTVAFYDHVPERAAMPYLVFDEPQSGEWDVTPTETDEGFGKEHNVQLHTWSAYEGKKQTNEMLRAIEVAMRDPALSLTGHRLINIRFQFSDRLRDPDGQAYHGIIQFRVVTEEI